MVGNKDYRTESGSEDCPVIGLLTESVAGLYQSNIWFGASDTALKNDYGILCFAGGSLNKSSWDPFEPQRNAIYNLIDTGRLKGLILSGSIGGFVSNKEFEDFYNKFCDIPMVCLGPEVQSLPTVVFDNTSGMRDLISHLVSFHSCRRIAFIRGPEGNEEAEQRLNIFREILTENGLAPLDELIVPGDFSRDAGANAVRHLLDECNLSFDAIVGANDDMALGALKAFQERHIRVPDEVLVVGFDGIEESGFSIPPLTTVRQPMYEMGCKAVELLINKIEKKPVTEIIVVPAVMEIRQSCGCYRFSSISSGSTIFSDSHLPLEQIKNHLITEVSSAFKKMRIGSIVRGDSSDVGEIVSTYIEELTNEHAGKFILIVNKLAWHVAVGGGDVTGLLRVIAIFRKFTLAYYRNSIPEYVEELLQNANLGITDAASRVQAHRRMESERQWMLMRAAGQAIASAFDLEHLLKVIQNELVNFEIKGCWLSLYKNPMLTLDKFSCVFSMRDGLLENIDSPIEFERPLIAPQGVIPIGIPGSFLVEPLFFRSEQIGVIVFQVIACRNGLIYEMLRQHISSALKGALLMKKVQEQSLALETANVQLQKLRDAEHAYLEAIKHELELGRDIQGSFFPREMPVIDGWEIRHAFQPAREVSGDFYDVFVLPSGHITMLIADVSGKDVGAALFMALISTLIRALSEVIYTGLTNPLDTINLTNRYLINHHYGNNGRYMYVTLFMAVLDLQSNTITYVNAGHNPPAIVKSDGGIRKWIDPTGPAVGIIPDAHYTQNKMQLEPGEMLFTYTDGVTEAKDSDGALFSKKKLAEILERKFSSASEVVNQVEADVKAHCEGQAPHDDITMLVLRRKEAAGVVKEVVA